MNEIQYAYVSRPDAQKTSKVPNCHSNRKSAIFIQSYHFTPIFIHFYASYFNELLLQIEHHRLPNHSVSSSNLEDEKLSNFSLTSNMVGVVVRYILMLRNKASSPYNFNIHFPLYTKYITYGEDVALNTSMHQYCVLSVAQLNGERTAAPWCAWSEGPFITACSFN